MQKSELFDYYWYAYTDWNMGESYLDIGVKYGHITLVEKQSIMDGIYIE